MSKLNQIQIQYFAALALGLVSLLLNAAFIFIFAPTSFAQTDQSKSLLRRVVAMEVHGANRTSLSWLEDYLDLSFPAIFLDTDVVKVRTKLMTTEVFVRVEVELKPTGKAPNEYILHVDLNEKWTTIPVIRGAYGGGTPLVVAGVHDTHTFGRLWTLGAEGRRYGTSPWSAVAWARAPRWLTGKHVVGLELWREFRERTIYDYEGEQVGEINTNTSRLRGLVAAPLTLGRENYETNWQAGLDLEVKREAPLQFNRAEDIPESVNPRGIRLDTQKSTQSVVLPSLIYDSIDVDGQNMDGLRLIAKSGPMFGQSGSRVRSEFEAFAYKLWPGDHNFAFHSFTGIATSDSMQSQYFLGGLESIRGIPDGYIYGNRASYLNLEYRKMAFTSKYLLVQEVIFLDSGGAGNNWKNVQESWRTSVGGGVRLSIPQVNRLTFRIDYAWTVDGKGGQGISAGLNHLFQPYKPL